jgi:hypothetical protein
VGNWGDGSVLQIDSKTHPHRHQTRNHLRNRSDHNAVWVAIGDNYCDTVGH